MDTVKAKNVLANLAHALGVVPQAYQMRMFLTVFYPGALKNNFLYWISHDRHELSVPSYWARIQVAGTADVRTFIDSGRLGFTSICDVLARNGVALGSLNDILDFGCGCGRVLRHWRGVPARIHGTDINEYLVSASKRSIPFATISKNTLEPKLDYADESFDLVYALSVFTHLDVEMQMAWLAEFKRVLRPRGILILSVHGNAYQSRLSQVELADYLAGRPVVRRGVYPGGNICVAFHPPSFVIERIAQGFDMVEAVPQGAKGNPVQDLYMLKKAT